MTNNIYGAVVLTLAETTAKERLAIERRLRKLLGPRTDLKLLCVDRVEPTSCLWRYVGIVAKFEVPQASSRKARAEFQKRNEHQLEALVHEAMKTPQPKPRKPPMAKAKRRKATRSRGGL